MRKIKFCNFISDIKTRDQVVVGDTSRSYPESLLIALEIRIEADELTK